MKQFLGWGMLFLTVIACFGHFLKSGTILGIVRTGLDGGEPQNFHRVFWSFVGFNGLSLGASILAGYDLLRHKNECAKVLLAGALGAILLALLVF